MMPGSVPVSAGAAGQRCAIRDDVLDQTERVLQDIAHQIGDRDPERRGPLLELLLDILGNPGVYNSMFFLLFAHFVSRRITNVIQTYPDVIHLSSPGFFPGQFVGSWRAPATPGPDQSSSICSNARWVCDRVSSSSTT